MVTNLEAVEGTRRHPLFSIKMLRTPDPDAHLLASVTCRYRRHNSNEVFPIRHLRPEGPQLSFSDKVIKKTTDGSTRDDSNNYIKITFLGISAWA